MIQHGIHQEFGFGARDQDTIINDQIKTVEFAMAYQIGNRFGSRTARHQLGKAIRFLLR